jgi:23S rRNA (pseudouridine1915-N3)-methyltransferase
MHANFSVNLEILNWFQRMKIILIVIGKTEKTWLQEGLDVYVRRLSHYIPFELKTIPDLKNSSNLSKDLIKDKESDLLLPFISGKKEIYLLDEKGKEYTSRQLAAFLEKKIEKNSREITFVIGGIYGFSEKTIKNSSGQISLSKLTFSHQMVRLLFVEQLYRAFTILKGEPYHHD